MGHLLLACLVLIAFTCVVHGQQTCPASTCFYDGTATRDPNQAQPNLYFVIGGLFDVHNKGSNALECSKDMPPTGIVNVMAFFWGIQQYYQDIMGAVPRPVTVGAVAFDSCMRPDQTIENVLSYAQCKVHIQGMAKENVVAYIGPYMNEDARRTGMLARDLKMTLLSPSANSMSLNFADQTSLLRMAPSFMYDLKGIVAFLDHVKAGFVMILYSGDDMFWKAAYDELTMLLKMKSGVSVCVQYTANVDQDQMSGVVTNLATRTDAKYVVPLMSRSKLDTLMGSINNNNGISAEKLVFILTSDIGQDRDLLVTKAVIANNTIIIDQDIPSKYKSKLDEFRDKYYMNARANASLGVLPLTDNPWLAEYVSLRQLPDLNDTAVASPFLRSIARTLMSVDAVIQGMDAVFKDCNQQPGSNYQFCDAYRNLQGKGDAIYTKIFDALKVHGAQTGQLRNDEIHYTYYNFYIRNSLDNNAVFQSLGSLSVDTNGNVSISLPDLTDQSRYGPHFSPPTCPSNVPEECCLPPTTAAPPTTTTTMGTGAVGTTAASQKTYTDVRYPWDQAITGAFANQPRNDSMYGTRFDLGHKWIIALGVLAGLGILCVIVFEIYILYKLLGTRMGSNWRTMWLGQLLLFGLFLCYLVLFAYIPIPTKATCGIIRFGVGVSYAFCFAVLLVKLMVILTSKPSDNMLLPGDVESPNYLKGIYQFLMFVFAVGVQIVIDIQWLITVPPEAVYVTANNGEKVWICNHYTWEAGSGWQEMSLFVRTNFENHLMSLIYIMVMIFITTVLSLNAHGIITNHRESVFIGIAAGFSIPIWLAWGLVGGLNKDHEFAHEFGDACIAFGLFLTATLILFAMFLPKVRQLVNMGVEGIYLEDDRETYYAGSVIMAPPSYKSKGPGSVIYVNNQGILAEPVYVGNGDPSKEGGSNHMLHPGSTYSAPITYRKNPDSLYGGSRVLKVTDDLRGRPPQRRPQSEIAYGTSGRPRSAKGTLPRSRSQTNLGAL